MPYHFKCILSESLGWRWADAVRVRLSGRPDLGHKAKVQYADFAIWGADEVAGVGVSMQEACLQQLYEVAVQQRGAQLPHITRIALA